MIQVILEVLIVGLLTMLAGIILMVVNDIVNDGHSTKDNRYEVSASSEPHDGEEPHERASRQSKADVGVLAVRRES